MKKVKLLICIILSVTLIANAGMAFAETNICEKNVSKISQTISSSNNEVLANIEEYLAYAIMINDEIDSFESDFNTELLVKPKDFTAENFNVNAEWIDDAGNFVDNYIEKNNNRNLKASSETNIPNAQQTAKAKAIMYSIDKAVKSVNRNPSRDLNKESQYMFISHYIDRTEYYWSSNDERYLLDGAGMSGYLADYLCASDRNAYEIYMKYTDVNSALSNIGNIAVNVSSFSGAASDIAAATGAIATGDTVMTIARGLTLQNNAISAADVIKNDVIPLYNMIIENISNDPNTSLSYMYDRFMEDEGLMGMHLLPDKETIVSTSLAMAGALMLSGPIGAVSVGVASIVTNALSFAIDTYTNFFKYAAWVALRTGFSMRYAERTRNYISGIG